jgi:hypothetical protein
MVQFLLGVLLAMLSFHINHNLKKVIDIKILINSLFELYGSELSYRDYNPKDVNIQLMQEIVMLEKMYDNNKYIKNEINKLIELRLIYFAFNERTFNTQLKQIGFKKLGKNFIILSFLNLKY